MKRGSQFSDSQSAPAWESGQSLGFSTSETARRDEKVRELVLNLPEERKSDSFESNFVEQLFRSAPDNFIESASLSEMGQIVEVCRRAYDRFLESGDAYFFELVSETDSEDFAAARSRLVVISSSRRFLVESILNITQDFDAQLDLLLRPVLRPDSRGPVSLVYAECASIDAKRLSELREQLNTMLDDLMLVTDDFSPILEQLQKVVMALRIQGRSQVAQDLAVDNDLEEIAGFFDYIAQENVLFLGYRRWELLSDLSAPSSEHSIRHLPEADLGQFRSKNPQYEILSELEQEVQLVLQPDRSFLYSRFYLRSLIQGNRRTNAFTVRTSSDDGKKVYVHTFLGLVNYTFLQERSVDIPYTRAKYRQLLREEKIEPDSFEAEQTRAIFRYLPSLRLLQGGNDTIRRDIRMFVRAKAQPETYVEFYQGLLKRFYSIFVVMPRSRYNEETKVRIQHYIEEELGAEIGSTDVYVSMLDPRLLRIQYIVPNDRRLDWSIDHEKAARKVRELSFTWIDSLTASLREEFSRDEVERLSQRYGQAFPAEYCAGHSPSEAVGDIKVLETLNDEHHVDLAIAPVYGEGSGGNSYDLKVYKFAGDVSLSELFPVLQYCGFDITRQQPSEFYVDGKKMTVQKFRVRPHSNRRIDPTGAREVLLPGLRRVLRGETLNDRFNMLLVNPGFTWRQIKIVRAISHYLLQVRDFRERTIVSAVTENPDIIHIFLEYFSNKFDPELYSGGISERKSKLRSLKRKFLRSLKNVSHAADERVLRAFLNIVDAMVRTNFYLKTSDSAFAFKLQADLVTQMPLPRPLSETFVYAADFQGAFLRNGGVARGGIRWCERSDFRAELIDLLPGRALRNASVVVDGAQGGILITKRLDEGASAEEVQQECYKRFVRALLNLTDNLVADGEVVRREDLVVYDEDDWYVAVAPDVGTEDFTGIANSIAKDEFNYWLGDAFAAGGGGGEVSHSNVSGESTWISIARHLAELGIDPTAQEIRVVGVGAVSDPRFAQGLLFCDKIKLVAAFDDDHVIVDPNPDPIVSQKERRRLLDTAGSTWKDYNTYLLSPGGSIYSRGDKDMVLGRQVEDSLGISADIQSANELVRAILRAPVDLLYIAREGTFVRASDEENISIGDRLNDEIRVEARELRAKIVGEASQRTVTQRGRVEYARAGGRINHSTIDRCGHVEFFDREANLRILLGQLVRDKKIDKQQSEKLFIEASEEIHRAVRQRSEALGRSLSIAARHSKDHLDEYLALVRLLEQDRFFDRTLLALPSDEVMRRRLQLRSGLTRPDLAVLLAQGKIALYRVVINSDLVEDPAILRLYLNSYFSEQIQQDFSEEILQHPLRREIVAASIVNDIVEFMGPTFVGHSVSELSVAHSDVVKAYLAAQSIVGGRTLLAELTRLETPETMSVFLSAVPLIQKAVSQATIWLLSRTESRLDFEQLVERYQAPLQELLLSSDFVQPGRKPSSQLSSFEKFIDGGIKRDLLQKLLACDHVGECLEIVDNARSSGLELSQVAGLYSELMLNIGTQELLESALELEPNDQWEASAVKSLTKTLQSSVGELTRQIISQTGSASIDDMTNFLNERYELVERYRKTRQRLNKEPASFSSLLVASRQLSALIEEGPKRNNCH